MNVLIVYAHNEPQSFTAALKDTAVSSLRAHGHEVEVCDLYGEEFDPVGGRHDFTTVANPDLFHYQTEQAHAAQSNGFADDLDREHARLSRADAVVFVFPLWWGTVPAILKGWFDRVLAYGVAYEDGMRYELGLLRGRTAILAVTAGGLEERFVAGGAHGPMEWLRWPTQHCTLEYLGFTALEPFVTYAAPRISAEEREQYLVQWRERVLDCARVVETSGVAVEPLELHVGRSPTTWTS